MSKKPPYQASESGRVRSGLTPDPYETTCPECGERITFTETPTAPPWLTTLLTEVSAAVYLGTPTPNDLRRVLMDVPLTYLIDTGLTSVIEAVCERDGSPFS